VNDENRRSHRIREVVYFGETGFMGKLRTVGRAVLGRWLRKVSSGRPLKQRATSLKFVIPAKAGNQRLAEWLGARLRGHDW